MLEAVPWDPLDWAKLETGRPEAHPQHCVRGKDEELKGTSGGGADRLAESCRGGGRGRLGRDSEKDTDLTQGNETGFTWTSGKEGTEYSELGRNSGDEWTSVLEGTSGE